MQIFIGSYAGNGSDNRGITGVGFQPDFVLIKGNAAVNAVCRTSTMAGDATRETVLSNASFADGIQSLDSDGFTVGTHGTVNTNTTCYQFICIRDNSALDFKVGSYTGSGASQAITGAGFTPDWAYIFRIDGTAGNPLYRTSSHSGDSSQPLDSSAATNGIVSLDADGFTVGTLGSVNSSGVTYYYVLLKKATGIFNIIAYAGNSTDNTNITGAGFQPDLAIVKGIATGSTGFMKFKDQIGDTSFAFDTTSELSNRIQALQADGCQVGTNVAVNTTFNYVASFFKAGASTPVVAGGGGKPTALPLVGVGR